MKKHEMVLGIAAPPPRLTWQALALVAACLSLPVAILLELLV